MRVAICSVLSLALSASCAQEDDLGGGDEDHGSARDPDDSAGWDEELRAPGVLVSPELFDLASRWSAEALSPTGDDGAATATSTLDLPSYARLHAPALVNEAIQAMDATAIQPGIAASGANPIDGIVTQDADCSCSMWAKYTLESTTPLSGPSWTMSPQGAAHSGHIYNAESGHTAERVASSGATGTEFRTRIICLTPSRTPCSAGCSARMYTDVRYSARAYAEAHVWTIWNRAATTQVVDGVTLDLMYPDGGGTRRLREKAASVHHYSNNKAYEPDDLAAVVKLGLAVIADPSTLITDANLLSEAIGGVFGLINSGTSSNDGSHLTHMKMKYESIFDPPIIINYNSSSSSAYGLDLTSELAMRIRGWGYHSETGDAKSSYSMAAYFDNFVCDPGVTPPRPTGYWRYDGYSGAPYSIANLRALVSSFFGMVSGGGTVDVSASEGEVTRSPCGDLVCSLESPSTCPGDCGYCNDGTCNPTFESPTSCPSDCGYCSDGTCNPAFEDAWSCPGDCGYCGDGICSEPDCPEDCGCGEFCS
jgi:hypothetical protein